MFYAFVLLLSSFSVAFEKSEAILIPRVLCVTRVYVCFSFSFLSFTLPFLPLFRLFKSLKTFKIASVSSVLKCYSKGVLVSVLDGTFRSGSIF